MFFLRVWEGALSVLEWDVVLRPMFGGLFGWHIQKQYFCNATGIEFP